MYEVNAGSLLYIFLYCFSWNSRTLETETGGVADNEPPQGSVNGLFMEPCILLQIASTVQTASAVI